MRLFGPFSQLGQLCRHKPSWLSAHFPASPALPGSSRRTDPVSLPNSGNCLVFRYPYLRARIFGAPACADAGCRTARVGNAASDSKHLRRYGSETGSVLREVRRGTSRREAMPSVVATRPLWTPISLGGEQPCHSPGTATLTPQPADEVLEHPLHGKQQRRRDALAPKHREGLAALLMETGGSRLYASFPNEY